MDRTLAELRAAEFRRLDEGGHAYLDYTGGGLYAESQVRAHADLLARGVFGNPHSQNPTSLASTHNVEAARERIRRFFDADKDEYEVIFALNASGALKLVGESYPFGPGSRYLMTSDNHNSVNGIREFACAKGAEITYIPLTPDLRVADVESFLAGADASKPNLFAYPAQSNFSGAKHPLAWIERAHALGWDVLLDAAAFVPTNRLSLREVRPDFVSLSFYKMFGFPTGVGALIARREALAKLRRPWFGGGTVRFVSAQNQLHMLVPTGEAFEDGTLNYLSIAGVPVGLDFLEQVGMERINAHVREMTGLMLEGMKSLRHSNGAQLIRIYGPRTLEARGGNVAFNVLTPGGELVDSKYVEKRANEQMISLRSGCFCNPGAAEFAFGYSAVDAYRCFNDIPWVTWTLQQFSACMNDMPVGAVRASVGIATNSDDVHRFLDFMQAIFFDCRAEPMEARALPEFIDGS